MPGVTLRQKLGALVYDVPRFAGAMRRGTPDRAAAPWVFMRNRSEQLEPGPGMRGARCRWQWTSRLHVADVFPWAGRRLMARALDDWPIETAEGPASSSDMSDISFVIGHRGRARLPLLRETLRSIAAQRDASVECIVVEHSVRPEIEGDLPGWVRYAHAAIPSGETPYNRARTFNFGAAIARAGFLVFHDNDMLVPRDYAAELLRLSKQGWDFVNLKRFIFYLDETTTRMFLDGGLDLSGVTPVSVIQNAEGGGSLGCSREAFLGIGGWDDGFTGWGGEDNEFWERASTRKAWPFGYCPLVHLWHEDQPGKAGQGAGGSARYWDVTTIDPRERILRLVGRAEHLAVSEPPDRVGND